MKFNYSFPYYFVDLSNDGQKSVSYSINNNHLNLVIDLGSYEHFRNSDILLEVECSETLYRNMFVVSESHQKINILLKKLGAKVKFALMYVAKNEGNITVDDNTDYYERGDCFGLLEKGQILIEESKGLSGLIQIGPTDKNTLSYDLNNDYITIEMPKKTYEKYIPWQNDDGTIPYILASLGSSCIQYAILKAKNEEKIKRYQWWETISEMLEEKGYDVEDISSEDVPGATNRILNDCFQRMINAAVPQVDTNDSTLLS